MNKAIKKLFGKANKGDATANHESHEDRRARVRRSRSMPLRSSGDTDDSASHIRPVYRGQRPLQASDVQLVLDISAANNRDWSRYPDMIDLFPAPPKTVVYNGVEHITAPSTAIQRTPSSDFVPDIDLLPFVPTVVPQNQRLQRLKEGREHERRQREPQRIHGRMMSEDTYTAQPRRTAMQRSNSSASGYFTSSLSNNPTTNYVPDLSRRPKPVVRRDGDGYVHPPPITKLPNFSPGANAKLKAGPAARYPVVEQAVAHDYAVEIDTVAIDPLHIQKKAFEASAPTRHRARYGETCTTSMSRVKETLPYAPGQTGFRQTHAGTHQGKPNGARTVRR